MGLLLWDIDGTLVTTGGAGRRALQRAAQSLLGIAQADAGITFAGNTDYRIVETIYQQHLQTQPNQAEVDALLGAYCQELEQELKRLAGNCQCPGAYEAVLLGAANHVQGLCTGNIALGAQLKLEHSGLWQHFPFGGFGHIPGERYLVVEMAIANAMSHAGRSFHPREILVIGDTPRDIQAAHAHDVACLAVATGPFSVEELRQAGADFVLASLAEFAHFLPHWNSTLD